MEENRERKETQKTQKRDKRLNDRKMTQHRSEKTQQRDNFKK